MAPARLQTVRNVQQNLEAPLAGKLMPYSSPNFGLFCLHAMCFERPYWFYSQVEETRRFLQNHLLPQLICLIPTELFTIVWRRSSKSWLQK